MKGGIWNKLTKYSKKSIIFEENFDETPKTIYGYVKKYTKYRQLAMKYEHFLNKHILRN